MEQAGTFVADGNGDFELLDVNAGQFTLTVIDPATGDRGKAFAKIETEGQIATADVKMNGQGTVVVTVIDGNNNTVPNSEVTLTALGAFLDTRTASTDSTGRVTFERVMAGDLTVSTRDRPSGLIGTALGLLPVGGTLPITLRLQPVGTIKGVVFGIDGSSLQEGVQVRIISRERGIVSQAVTGADGAFSFNPLPLSDGPYALDAFFEGRLRARIPGLVLSTPNQVVTQNLTFMPVGTVTGLVTDSSGRTYPGATVTLQMTEGLRLAFDAKADAAARFFFPAIPVGNYTITAAKDGRSGSADGRVNADAEAVTTNVLLATNSLIGTVFQRDGVTPVAGAKVYLLPSTVQTPPLTINPNTAGVLSTTSGAQGQFAFPIPKVDNYIIQAESGDDRGRTPVIVTTIDPTNPVIANVTFLPKGIVTGVVKDAGGAVQPNVIVRVTTTGAFNNTWEGTADGSGRYSLGNIFVGNLSVLAINSVSKLAGTATGRLLTEAEVVNIDVTLAATGKVTGRVLRRDNSVVPGALKLELRSGQGGGSLLATQDISGGAAYQFDLVPVGDFSVTATETANGDKGIATSRISIANEIKNLDVRLVGQGTVKVKTVDETNAPVSGTRVTLKTEIPFRTEVTLTTDGEGFATFEKVFAGDHTIEARKTATIGTRVGTASGTLIAGQTNNVTITLTSRPIGKIKGTLFGPDGVTPQPGKTIRLLPEPTSYAYTTTTDAAGKFSFANIEGGSSYTLTARNYDFSVCNRDRVRAQATGVQITAEGQEVERNLQMLGSGKVSGKIVNLSGVGVGGIRVRLTNPDPVYGPNTDCSIGTAYQAFSAADGSYAYQDIPAGNFTIVAENYPANTMRGEGSGRVRFDTDDVTLDVELLDNAVVMPKTLNDANSMSFDITGDGSIGNGKLAIFRGTGSESRGMRLDVVVNNVPVPFTNGDGTVGRLALDNQELQVNEDNLASGLKITRKVFVPRTGYFARYLEVLENTTLNPITVGLRVVTRHSAGVAAPRVVDSSDGDQILSVIDGQFRDRWVVVDDSSDTDPYKTGSVPATGHVFDGENGATQVTTADYELVGQTGKLTWQWNNVTVQPGGTAILMHLAFNQLDRVRARQAALRLSQVPPEILEGLTTEEREAIRNFRIPAEGVDNVEKLPAVNAGVIKGRVVSGDGVTPIANSSVHFKSKSALYGRDFTVTADAGGNYELKAKTDGSMSAMPIPLYPFDIDATHPYTGAKTSDSTGDFVAPATEVVKDLIFNGTGNVRGSIKRHSGGLVEGASVFLCLNDDRDCSGGSRNFSFSKADGGFLLSGSVPLDYFIFFYKIHPQQPYPFGQPIRGRATTTVTAGNTTVTDVIAETTGTVTGIVRAASGDPVENADVAIWFTHPTNSGLEYARVAKTDTAGRYRFFDVRTGAIRVDVVDGTTGASGQASSIALVDQEVTRDVTLNGFGTINVQVNFARGVPAPNSLVNYSGQKFGGFRTDSAGKGNTAAPVGSYTFEAVHPDEEIIFPKLLNGTSPVSIASNGQVVDVTVTLKAAGAVKGTIVRPDGSTLADGFPYTIKALNNPAFQTRNGLKASSTGQYRAGALPLGYYIVTAFDPVLNRFADSEFQVAEDGQEVEVNLSLEDNRIALPADLLDANRMRFDVQQSGALNTGHFWAFNLGGLKLEVNGQQFTGDTSAALEAGKRQFAITQDAPISGLKVTRKVFVPLGAYFARYLEIFENPTGAPITLGARVSSGYKTGQLLGSSSGDATLTTADTWVTLDDAVDEDVALVNEQMPALGHVFGQAGAPKGIDEATFTAGASNTSTIVKRWSGITVPAGGKVALMHFTVQQLNRAGVTASVQRLAQLPPEAIDSLTTSEIQSIVNFAVPVDGASPVPPLPSLFGSATGRILEGDGVTGVPAAWATVQSSHPIFSRVWGMKKDASSACSMAGTAEATMQGSPVSTLPNALPAGSWSVFGRLTATTSIPLPEGLDTRVVVQEGRNCFGNAAGHTWTHIPSRQYTVQLPVARDVVFDSGILMGTITGYIDFQSTSGRVYLSTDNPEFPDFRYVPIRPDGTYLYPGIPPGAYDVLADTPHPQGAHVGGTGLRGSRSGSVVTLGFTTVTDVQLQPAGSIQGAVLTANGEGSVSALVDIAGPAAGQTYDQCATGCVPGALGQHKGKRSVSRQTRTDSLGRYNLSAVPAGSYTLTVTDPISDGKKIVALNVAEGQAVVQNVTLLPLGTVQLTVTMPNGQPAVDAFVYLYADAQGFEEVAGRTDSAGKLTIANIPQGGFTIRVRDPRKPDDTYFDRKSTGAITVGGEVQQVSLRFLAIANVRVTAVDGDNGNIPVQGANVFLEDVRTGNWFLGTTDASGLTAESVQSFSEGAYVIRVSKTVEGTSANTTTPASILITDDGTTKAITAALRRTVGSARAVVVDSDSANAPIPNADVFISDANRPTRVFLGRTDATGQFFIPGIAQGAFVVSARATLNGVLKEAEAAGSINSATIGQTQVMNLGVQSSIVPLPRNLTDANAFTYDIQANGSIARGTLGYQYQPFNAGASVLEVNSVAFTGSGQGTLQAGTHQIAIVQPIAGLNVTRKVFVPREGYFARYLEIFDNPTGSPITVNAKVTHRTYNRDVISTSSGDSALETGDTWVAMDDALDAVGGSEYPTAHVHGQAGARKALDALTFGADSAGLLTGAAAKKLAQTWSAITVPANGRVALMHFVVQQVNRGGSTAAAQRLAQLPPEALDAMTSDEVDAVLNFNVPAQSALPPLPSLTGAVQGRVLDGDGTPMPFAQVSIRSANPLYPRSYLVNADAQGNYALAGTLADVVMKAIPTDAAVSISSVRTGTNVPVAYSPTFATGASLIVHDVTYPTGKVTGTLTGAPDYLLPPDATVSAYRDGTTFAGGTVTVRADGTYLYAGLAEGTYEMRLAASHAQGTGMKGSTPNVAVTVGALTTANVAIEPSGSVTGTVSFPNGQPASRSMLLFATGFTRATQTDAQGRYTFTAVPVGTYTLRTTDVTGVQDNATVTVGAGQAVIQNMTVLGHATLQLTVNHARGVPAQGAQVYITTSIATGAFAGSTNAAGRLDITVPVGSFSLSAYNPGMPIAEAYRTTYAGTAGANGDVVPVTVVLKAIASVRVTVSDDETGNVVGGAAITIQDAYSTRAAGSTNASGQAVIAGVPQGAYTVNATTAAKAGTVTGSITAADDNLTVDMALVFSNAFDILGVMGQASEEHIFTLPVTQGQKISVQAYGEAVGAVLALPFTMGKLYDPNKNLIAQTGRLPGPTSAHSIYAGNLNDMTAAMTGNYTIGVLASTGTGGYRLKARVADAPFKPLAYTPTGTVAGRVMHQRGVPAVGDMIRFSTTANPWTQVYGFTDATGNFQVAAPSGVGHTVYWRHPDVSFFTFFIGSATALATGETKTYANLVLPKEQIVNTTVRFADLAPAPNLDLTVSGSFGYTVKTDPAGTRALYVYGPSVSVRVFHHENADIAPVYSFNDGADGDARTLDVVLPATGWITGRVTNWDGAVLSRQVTARYPTAWYTVAGSTTANSGASGYTLKGIPANVAVTLEVAHPDNPNIKITRTVTIPAHGATAANEDFVMPQYSQVTGTVTHANGTPAVNRTVEFFADGSTAALSTATTGANGAFTMKGIPPGTSGRLAATNTTTGVKTYRAVTFPATATTLTGQDLAITGIGTINGRMLLGDGTGVSQLVFARWFVDDGTTPNTQTFRSSAAVTGQFSFANAIPVGRPVTIFADANSPTRHAERTVTLTSDGEVIAIDLQYPLSRSLAVEARDALGRSAVIGQATTVVFKDVATGVTFKSQPIFRGGDQALAEYVTAPTVRVELLSVDSNLIATADIPLTPGQRTLKVFPLSLVTGTVRFADATTVASLSLNATQQSITTLGGVRTYRGTPNGSGTYDIVGMLPADYEIFAQDAATALSTTAAGTVPSDQAMVTHDVTLPPAGTVTGVLRLNGTPVASQFVYLRAGNMDASRLVSTNASGVFTFQKVPVGPVAVESRHSASGISYFGAGSGVLSGQGATVTLDINLAVTVGISGTVRNGSGVGLAGVPLEIERGQHSISGLSSVFATSSSTPGSVGNYSALAFAGDLRVIATSTTSGIGVYTLGTTALTGADTTIGSAVNVTSYDLRPASPQPLEKYTLNCDGKTYGNLEVLSVNGDAFPCSRAAYFDSSLNEATFGPFKFGDLRVTRRVYAPTSGSSFSRYVETITNESSVPVVVDLKLRGNTTNGLTYRADRRSWVSHGASTTVPYKVHVLAGTGAVQLPTVVSSGSAQIAIYRWKLSIPAGESAKVMHFVVARGESCTGITCISPTADAFAATLVDGSESAALTGLTADDRATIRNFIVP